MIGRPPNKAHDLWRRVDVREPDECWPFIGSTRRGYGDFKIRNRHFAAHRLAYRLATGVDPGDLQVCHRCDNKPCCNPSHLFLGSLQDNVADRQAKGRQARLRGGLNAQARLTEQDVLVIRRRRENGETGRAIAADFGISPSHVSSLHNRHRWSHV